MSYLLSGLTMPFPSLFLQSQQQSENQQENDNHTSQFEYPNFLLSGISDPPSALENAFPSDVFFPNDDYPPGFPCTSGCGKKFPTVIMQEIHVQHYCKGPYDEIESCQETSVAAFYTASISSNDDYDEIPRLPSSPGTSQLEPDPALIPAISISSGSDHGVTSQLPSSPGIGQLELDPSSIPAANNGMDLKCLLCGKYLSSRQSLKYHIAVHKPGHIFCSVGGCRYSARSQGALDLHMNVNHSAVTNEREGEILSCCHCGRIMNNKNQLRRHLRNHDAGKFPCPIENCSSQVMSTLAALDHHLKFDHADCQRCGSLL